MIYNIVNKTFSFVAKNWKVITTGVTVVIASVTVTKSQKRQNNKQRKVDEMNK